MLKTSDALLQVSWHLFTDVITRLNLLVDECNHLQQTVHNHLSTTKPEVFGFYAKEHDLDKIQRPWIPSPADIRDEDYYFRRPQERALRNLYVTAGAIGQALEDNTETLRQAFDKVLLSSTTSEQCKASDALYWFLSLRGHVLSRALTYYLTHLQHAQEKLIQILENMPGNLPGPTLLRRWSSGAVGEFLSEYSRHVNGQIQKLLWTSCVGDITPAFADWRKNQFLIHTWSHNPTSRTTRNRVAYPTGEASNANTISFTTIWSSYFYLEQPILFPLLYHECAHHFANEKTAFPNPEQPRRDAQGRALWFESAQEAAALLARAAPLENGSQQFWSDFVGELWSDTVSIALCGQGYLVPLMLQITALQTTDGELSFSDFDTERDAKINLNEIGQPGKRNLPVPYPSASMSYLWTARALFALKVFEELFQRTAQPSTWLEPLREIVDGWRRSGAVAMAEKHASAEHASFWAYCESFNNWVVDVSWDCLKDFVKSLRPAAHQAAEESEYNISPALLSRLSDDVSSYAKHFLKVDSLGDMFSADEAYRLEDLCPAVRWQIGSIICKSIKKSRSAGVKPDEPEIKKWTRPYVDYIECDGSVAFRLATEWLAIQRDIVAAAAAHAKSKFKPSESTPLAPPADLTAAEMNFLRQIQDAVEFDWQRMSRKYSKEEYGTLLAMLGLSRKSAGESQLVTLVDAVLQNYLKMLEGFENQADNVGTLTLGVIRPHFASRTHGYGQAVREVATYLDSISQFRLRRIQKSGLNTKSSNCDFMPLFGEYSFASYQPGLASINKMFRPWNPPTILQKPRTALRILRRDEHVADKAKVVRVAQMSFKYRWQWLLLAQGLNQAADLYLSSGWEDVILITYHPEIDSISDEYASKKLKSRTWLDVHSNIGLPAVPAMHEDATQLIFASAEPDYHKRWQAYGYGPVSERTGRYDLTVEWNPCHPPEMMQVWRYFTSVPAGEWRQMEGIATSVKVPGVQGGPYQFVTQVMLKLDPG